MSAEWEFVTHFHNVCCGEEDEEEHSHAYD